MGINPLSLMSGVAVAQNPKQQRCYRESLMNTKEICFDKDKPQPKGLIEIMRVPRNNAKNGENLLKRFQKPSGKKEPNGSLVEYYLESDRAQKQLSALKYGLDTVQDCQKQAGNDAKKQQECMAYLVNLKVPKQKH